MISKLSAGTVLASATLMLVSCSKAAQFSCPVPEQGSTGGIRESATQLRATQAALGTGSENEIADAVPAVLQRHRGAGPDMVANYLVAAYCPTIASRDVSVGEKTQELNAFAERARRVARRLRG